MRKKPTEAEARQKVFDDASQGSFHCTAYERTQVINGSRSFVYGVDQPVMVTLNNAGLNVGSLLYYYNELAGKIANVMPLHNIVTSTTQEYELYIPWSKITGCQKRVIHGNKLFYKLNGFKLLLDNSVHFRIFFFNDRKRRPEWIELSVLNTDHLEVDIFIQKVQKHGIIINDEDMAN